MPVAFIPKPLRDLTAGRSEVSVDGATVGEVIEALDRQFPGLAARIRRGELLAPGLQVSIDHVMTSRGLAAVVGPDSEVHFLPAIGGGGDRSGSEFEGGTLAGSKECSSTSREPELSRRDDFDPWNGKASEGLPLRAALQVS